MNNINSVFIEGTVCEDVICENEKSQFTIRTTRQFCKGLEIVTEVYYFDVEAHDGIAKVCFDYGKKGQEVRLTGRLKMTNPLDSENRITEKVFIVAEHIQFKPE